VETTTRRLKQVEKALLKLAISRNLLANAIDFDENLEKILPPDLPESHESHKIADGILADPIPDTSDGILADPIPDTPGI
jgi:hypothetical protein